MWKMRDNDLRIIAVFVIIIAFVVLGVALSEFTFPSTTEESIEEEEEEEMELIGVYTAGFLKLYKIHDNKDNLTCWVYNGQGSGISCIPDHLLSP
jgi:hypothetical protein